MLQYFGMTSIVLTKFQLHSCVFVMFASFIAPFGGFFASGFKRAFEIKVSYISLYRISGILFPAMEDSLTASIASS